MKKHKIIFAAQDPGGFNTIAPIIKKLKKDARFNVSVILAKHACKIAQRENIKYLDVDKILVPKKINADLIFTATSYGDSIEKKLIAIGKHKKIPTISIIDFWSDYKIRFKKDLPDYILVIDEIMKKEMIEQGFSEKKIFITGNPFFDSFSKIKPKEKKDLIVFFSQPFSEALEVFREIVEAVERINPQKKITIKFHPRCKKLDKFDKIIKNSRLKIEKEKKLSAEDLIKQGEIIVGINSMVLFQAAMVGKKVLSYQPNLKGPDPLLSNRLGLSTSVYQKKEVYPVLKKMFVHGHQKKNLKSIKKYTENNSCQKVIDFMTNVLENNSKRKLKIIACIQTRMSSKRLKKKALLKISGKTIIENIFDRLKACQEIYDIVLSTSLLKENDILVKHAKDIELKYYRGKEQDLISRHYESTKKFKPDALLCITGDNPLVDPKLIDRMIKIYRKNYKKFDFFTNYFPRTFPYGLDISILPLATLKRLDAEIQDPLYRECFLSYILKNYKKFRIYNLTNPVNLSLKMRWTVDYPEDLVFTRKVFNALGRKNKIFIMKDILKFLKKNPQVSEINKKRIDAAIVQNI